MQSFSDIGIGKLKMTTFELKYLDFLNAREKIMSRYDIQLKECAILRVISRAYLHGDLIKVRTLIDRATIASPATIHKIMKILISKGMVTVNGCKEDGRIKFVIPTAKALKFYRELGKNM
jgi:DNA-binding MarR family transcriptional regulator